MEIDMFFSNSRWAIPSLLLVDRGYLGISQRLSDTVPIKNCPEAFRQPLGLSQRLSYTLLAVLSGCPTAFKSISQRLSAKTWQFHPFSLLMFIKSPRSIWQKNHQRLLSWDRFIQQHNFSPVSVSCDSPFKACPNFMTLFILTYLVPVPVFLHSSLF